jgi:hypothetical protein
MAGVMRIRICAESLDPDIKIADRDLDPLPIIIISFPRFPLHIKIIFVSKTLNPGLILILDLKKKGLKSIPEGDLKESMSPENKKNTTPKRTMNRMCLTYR